MSGVVPVALAGLVLALAFALMDAGRVRPDARVLPAFCRLNDRQCSLVLRHPHARLFGLPNYAAGIGYYALVLLNVIVPFPPPWDIALVILSWCVVGAGLFLFYSLLAVVRVNCVLCFAAHGVNLLLALMLSFPR